MSSSSEEEPSNGRVATLAGDVQKEAGKGNGDAQDLVRENWSAKHDHGYQNAGEAFEGIEKRVGECVQAGQHGNAGELIQVEQQRVPQEQDEHTWDRAFEQHAYYECTDRERKAKQEQVGVVLPWGDVLIQFAKFEERITEREDDVGRDNGRIAHDGHVVCREDNHACQDDEHGGERRDRRAGVQDEELERDGRRRFRQLPHECGRGANARVRYRRQHGAGGMQAAHKAVRCGMAGAQARQRNIRARRHREEEESQNGLRDRQVDGIETGRMGGEESLRVDGEERVARPPDGEERERVDGWREGRHCERRAVGRATSALLASFLKRVHSLSRVGCRAGRRFGLGGTACWSALVSYATGSPIGGALSVPQLHHKFLILKRTVSEWLSGKVLYNFSRGGAPFLNFCDRTVAISHNRLRNFALQFNCHAVRVHSASTSHHLPLTRLDIDSIQELLLG